jgi:osmoprotectant transport system substrate-binding protein
MRRHRWLGAPFGALVLLCSSLVIAACGSDDNGGGSSKSGSEQKAIASNSANKSTTFVVGSKNFAEQKVLGEIYAQGLDAAGYTVKTQLNLGDEKVQFKAMKAKQINAGPEYTGTALGSLFGVPSNKIPKDPNTAFQQTKADYAKQGFTAYPPTPFTSSNEVGVTQATAKKYKLTTISDLKPVAGKLTLYGSPECRQRLDCKLGLEQVYGLKFKKFVPVAIDLRHEVLNKGQADVSIVFTTDAANKRDNVVLLKDDKHMFPPYNSTLVVRDETAKKAGPDLGATVAKVEKGLTAPVMQELDARVELDKKTPKEVASEYLKESGLVK